MKDLTTALLLVGVLLVAYFVIDYMTTKDPNRRKRDARDIKILGAAMNAIK